MDGAGSGDPDAAVELDDKLAVRDSRFSLLGLAMWAGTAVKVQPRLSTAENVNSVVGMAGMFLISYAWPTWARRSYSRNRVAALAFLRVFLFALPFNFSLRVFNALAPDVATGRLAAVPNVFNAFMAIRLALLNFTSMGWLLPFRLHLVLQAVNVGLLVRFGLPAYVRSTLLTSAEIESVVRTTSGFMMFLAAATVPSVTIVEPRSIEEQRVAVLLLSWAVLGFLLPTLLLLPQRPAPARAGQGLAAQLGDALEAGLRLLLPPAPHQQRLQRLAGAGAGAQLPWLLCWWAVLLVTWSACCLAAPHLAMHAHAAATHTS